MYRSQDNNRLTLFAWFGIAVRTESYDSEGREVQRYATGYNRGRRCTAYNYDGTIASRTYSYKESYLPDMEEVYVYDSCGRLTSTTIRVDKAVSVPVLNPAAGQDAADSEATDTASPAASSRWATAVIRREYDAIGRLARLRHGLAATTEYTYDVHSWPVSQQTTYGAATNTSSIGYTLEYAPCYNGNIAKRTWAEGDYAYTYDALNRLESAVFTPAEGLADRPGIERDRIPDFSVQYCYDLRGNMTNVVRYGVVDAVSDFDRVETFGTLDELACSYDGNRLSNVTAITEALPFDGVTGLHADGEFELAYNDAGDMVSDASRGLLHTRWNADGHPMQYDLEGGHRQTLGWDAFGNHLYTSYETSVAPVSTGALPGRTRRTSLRAYSGDGHVLRGGAGNSVADTLEMLRFAGGYFDADLVPHYYVADYLGSNIAVIRSDGTLVQSATYYPYGEPHRAPKNLTAASTTNSYLFGGKELMTQDALDEYLYGARTYLPAATRFSSIDPLCEKYYHLSPYVFCSANPINRVDPTGLADYYDTDSFGYLGTDNCAETAGQIRDIQQYQYDRLLKKGADTAELMEWSTEVTVDYETIDEHIENIKDASLDDGLEHQVYVYYDKKSHKITAREGPVGDKDKTQITVTQAHKAKINFIDSPESNIQGQILIGQAHTHPEDPSKNFVRGTSVFDAATSHNLNIPIYAVDADASQQKGKPSGIHRVLPNGRANSFVGTTRGTQITPSFNITDDIISNYKRLNPYVR